METAYRSWEQRNLRSNRTHRGHKTNVSLGRKERRRLLQLSVCIVLFLVVFIGKGIFPGQMSSVQEKLTTLIGNNVDFQTVFANLGRSISQGEPVLDTLGNFCVEVFGGTSVTQVPGRVERLPTYEDESNFLTQSMTVAALFERRLGKMTQSTPAPAPVTPPLPAETAPEPIAPAETVPLPEAAVVAMEYSGPTLPDNATMDKYALGLGETTSPVSNWWLSSSFGWREHPVDGEEKFHNGIDMAVNEGTTVQAFAGGVIEYIGESPAYGLYTQIQHDNGVTTFYCHCSKLLVQQGQTVAVGEAVAQSGETGNATGPHLHFEIKKDGILLNPLYYIDTE